MRLALLLQGPSENLVVKFDLKASFAVLLIVGHINVLLTQTMQRITEPWIILNLH